MRYFFFNSEFFNEHLTFLQSMVSQNGFILQPTTAHVLLDSGRKDLVAEHEYRKAGTTLLRKT